MSKASFSTGTLLIVFGLCAACGRNKPLVAVAGGSGSGGDTDGAAGQSGAQPDASGAAGIDGATGGGGALATADAGDESAHTTDDAGDEATDDASADGQLDADGGVAEVLKVRPTMGCGHEAAQPLGAAFVGTIDTMGTKPTDCADTNCGPWRYTRQYFLTLPLAYDKNRAYPLIVELASDGATGVNVATLDSQGPGDTPANNLVDNSVIRVGLTPPPNTIGHATNPGEGLWDDHEGDDSVDWAFYENLYDKLAGQVCFDRNRVFIGGERRGATMVDEVGCKYAGDALRPVRGVLSDEGGLLTFDPKWLPTCTDKPMAGMWVHITGDTSIPFAQAKAAIARAMKVDGCTIGTGFDDAQFVDFPIGGANPDSTCQKIKGCPDLTPLVVCPILGNNTSPNPAVANPGFSTFLMLFETAPLLAP